MKIAYFHCNPGTGNLGTGAFNAARTARRGGRILWVAPIVTLTIGIVWALAATPARADGLVNLSVLLTSLAPGHANTGVLVSFTIEEGGPALAASDYIRIRFDDGFSNVSRPTGGSGWTGEPDSGVSGNTAFVTGVSASPGAVITITGVTVTNPPSGAGRGVSVEFARSLVNGSPFASASTQATGYEIGVSGTVPGTDLRVMGITSPRALVGVVALELIVGMALANVNGEFDRVFSISSLPGLTHGQEVSFTLTAQDTEGLRAAPLEVKAVIRLAQENGLEWVILPPTVRLSAAVIYPADDLTVSGRGAPDSDIVLLVDGTPYQSTVDADADGQWMQTLRGPWSVGSHEVQVINQDGMGRISEATSARFTVRTRPGTTAPRPVTPTPPGTDLRIMGLPHPGRWSAWPPRT